MTGLASGGRSSPTSCTGHCFVRQQLLCPPPGFARGPIMVWPRDRTCLPSAAERPKASEGGVRMRTMLRWIVAVVVVLHGLIHLLGAAMGVAWLAAAVLVVLAGVLLIIRARWWWVVGAVAVVASQTVILTLWSDAKAGTVANIILLAAVVYGYASQGPASYRAEYRRRVDAALTEPLPNGVVTEADLADLPEPVATYVRRSGAVGQPRVTNFQARIHGRIRAGTTTAWMGFTGEQVNTYGPQPSRLFFMDATMFGLPVDVLHTYVGPSATMRVKACSLVPMVNAAGPDMDQAETVTVFNLSLIHIS